MLNSGLHHVTDIKKYSPGQAVTAKYQIDDTVDLTHCHML